MKQYEIITKERLNEMFEIEEKLKAFYIEPCGNEEIDNLLYSTWQDNRTGTTYAVHETRTVHMGFNSNEPGTVEKFVEIVEREGECKASWGVTGRTMHSILAEQLKKLLPQYTFEIGYNYHLARKS